MLLKPTLPLVKVFLLPIECHASFGPLLRVNWIFGGEDAQEQLETIMRQRRG
jgi:hypothetical protein